MGLRVQRDQCAVHPNQDAAGTCGYCGKAICRECITANGYYCSDTCRQQNKKGVQAAQESTAAASMGRYQKGMRRFRLLAGTITVLILGGIGFVGYRLFLDPSGTVVWEWSAEAQSTVKLVAVTDDQALVLQDGTGKRLDVGSGEEQGDFKASFSGLEAIHLRQKRIIGLGAMRILSVSLDGKDETEIPLAGTAEATPVLNADASRACYVSRSPSTASEQGFVYTIHTVSLPKAKELGAVALRSRADRVQLLGISGDDVVLLTAREQAAADQPHRWQKNYDWRIELVNGKTGRTRRRAALSGDPRTPIYENGWAVFAVRQTLYAVNLLQKKQYDFRLAASTWRQPDYLLRQGQLLVVYDSGTVCYDLQDGQEKWSLNAAAEPENMVFTDDRIFILGGRTEEEEFDVSKMPGFNQAPEDLMNDFNMGKGSRRIKTIPLLAAVDRTTGDYLWQTEGIRGRLLGDDQRLVVIADVAQTANLGFLKTESELFVRQFDPDSGKKMYEKVSEGVAIENPHLAGDVVVARRLTDQNDTGIVGIALR